MAEPTHNLLNLEEPDAYYCAIRQYYVGHHEMMVQATHELTKERIYIVFNHVYCFSGILGWKSASLRQASEEEYLQFMHTMMPNSTISKAELLDEIRFGHLYIFEAEIGPVKVVAVSVGKFNSDDAMFKHLDHDNT